MRCHVAFLKFYIALSVRKAIICCALTQVDVSARTPLLTGDPSMVGSFPHHGCSTETSLSTFFVFFRAWLKSMPFCWTRLMTQDPRSLYVKPGGGAALWPGSLSEKGRFATRRVSRSPT